MGGPRPGGGYSKMLPYTSKHGEEMKLNSEEIKAAQYLDSISYIWSRNWKGFPYVDFEGEDRKFYPDFYLKDLDLYVEYKGWITDKMRHKMNMANKNNADLKLLIIVGDNKRYFDDGIPLAKLTAKEVTLEDPSIIHTNITSYAKQ